jgi:SAM-dependent methyltransferase
MSVAEVLPSLPDSAERAVERLRIEPSHSVLDLGCGEGRLARFIEDCHPRLHVGFDIGLASLRVVQRGEGIGGDPRPGRHFVCGDGVTAPFANGSFDRVVCSLVLYLLPLERAIRELARVVRPGGLVYARVPMLAWGRLLEAARSQSLRSRLYGASHVVSGAVYALAGRQVPNPFLRHDAWACYVPLGRFRRAVERGNFSIDALEIDWPRPSVPSIEAWLRRI